LFRFVLKLASEKVPVDTTIKAPVKSSTVSYCTWYTFPVSCQQHASKRLLYFLHYPHSYVGTPRGRTFSSLVGFNRLN